MRQIITPEPQSLPALYPRSKQLLALVRQVSLHDMMKLAKIKEPLAQQTLERFQAMKFDVQGTSALAAYDGLQFKSMKSQELDREDWEYLNEHLRILSGFYGVLRPYDSIYPYRLEMQAKFRDLPCKGLYEFWGSAIADQLMEEVQLHRERYILNLSSKEYEKAIQPYIPESIFINVVFFIEKNGKLKTESTQAKMARGRLVHYACTHRIQSIEELMQFSEDQYRYEQALSTPTQLVFVKRPI